MLQLFLMAAMSAVRPGQYMDAFALAVIPLVPWCAACRVSRHACRREDGMTRRLPRHTTSSTMVRSVIMGKYACIPTGSKLRLVGGPASMTSMRSWRDWSAMVAV